MAWPLILMGAGVAMQAYGQYRANQDQAVAERRNAEHYRAQAQYAREAGKREQKIQERKADRMLGEQVGSYAAAGVDIGSGSALDFLAESRSLAIEERAAIQHETDHRVQLAMLRAQASDTTADALSDPMNNLMQASGTILTGAGQMGAYSGGGTTTKPSMKLKGRVGAPSGGIDPKFSRIA